MRSIGFAAFRVDSGEDRRDSVRPRGLGESGDVVDHHRGLVAVNVPKLSEVLISPSLRSSMSRDCVRRRQF